MEVALEYFEEANKAITYGNRQKVITLNERFYRQYSIFTNNKEYFEANNSFKNMYNSIIKAIGSAYQLINDYCNADENKLQQISKTTLDAIKITKGSLSRIAIDLRQNTQAAAAK